MSEVSVEERQNIGAGNRRWIGAAAYLLTIVVAIGVFFFVRSIGESRARHSTGVNVSAAASSANSDPEAAGHAGPRVMLHVLATLSAVILTGFGLGQLFRLIGQPPVIGEVVAGILLGPSLLGMIRPDWMQLLIPDATQDPQSHVPVALKTIAQLGVLLYMFVVGLELNAAKIKQRAKTAVAISHMSIVVPFLLGAMLALWLYPIYCPAGVSFTSFSLFVAVAMAITAFPVLARILTDSGLGTTRLGSIALAAAAADDVTAWCLLALVVGIVQSQVQSAVYVVVGSLAFIAIMLLIVRPLAKLWCARLEPHPGPIPAVGLVGGLVAVLLAGLATESIGIHAIFGGFLLGAVIPHDSRLAEELRVRLRDLVTILLLPAFFAYTGMRTEIGLVSGAENVMYCAIIILVATAGKFGGTYVAARATGSDWRESSALGVLMNTRGLMELIVLNIGLDLGVISPTLFAMMVIMALATTLATAPILSRLIQHRVEEA